MSSDGQGRAPIAVFAYNRADKLAAMLTSLRRCHGFAQSEVRIFVDGAKGRDDADSVAAVRRVVRELDAPNLSYSFRDANLGLRNSIFAGVSEMIASHGRVIVLEDDLVLSPIALEYFNQALGHYETQTRVWSIAGYAYDSPYYADGRCTLVLPFAHPWGWATWARAWDRFHLDNRPADEQLQADAFRASFDMNGMYPFTTQLQNSINGRVNSWFIHWYYTVFQHGGVSIFPPRRVLDNFGFRRGSHGSSLNPYDRLVRRPALLEVVPDFCDAAVVNFAALDRLRSSRELRVQRFIARAGSARRAFMDRTQVDRSEI